jgi:hypothetical protein
MATEENTVSKTHLEDYPVNVPKIDDMALLADIRSPRFFVACRRLRIDPLELKSRGFESFQEKNVPIAIQQIRFAMHERARFQKWKAINNFRFSLSAKAKDSVERTIESSPTKSAISSSWIGAELAKTEPIIRRGKTEVFMSCVKTLREIASLTNHQTTNHQSSSEMSSRELDKRKDYIRKLNADKSRRQEKQKKAKELQLLRESTIQAREDELEKRRAALVEQWKTNVEKKKAAHIERVKSVQTRLAKAAKEREDAANHLAETIRRKDAVLQRTRSPTTLENTKDSSKLSSAAAAARWRRERNAQRSTEHQKQLMAEFKKQQQELDRKVVERQSHFMDETKVSIMH